MLSLLFPTVILVSAVASLLGAGAHLVTSQILVTSTCSGIGFGHWLLLGLPLAVTSAHLSAELVLLVFTRRKDRNRLLRIQVDALSTAIETRVSGPLTVPERVAGCTGLVIVTLWCATPVHGRPPALVALLGALAVAMPGRGGTSFGAALRTVPWSLLMFMAATAALGTALVSSGATGWLADTVFAPAQGTPPWVFLALVVAMSTVAHLVLQSRSARASELVPLVIPVASAVGVNPALAAFASTLPPATATR